jgi:hypothetical protein
MERGAVMRRLAWVIVMVAGCSPAKPPCERSIEGVWRTGETLEGEEVGWHFLDRRAGIEGYPTYREVAAEPSGDVRAAPAAMDLVREDGVLVGGRWWRRYELGGLRCVVAAPVHVTACAGDELVLELGPIVAPTDWTACAKPGDAATLARTAIAAPVRLRLHR